MNIFVPILYGERDFDAFDNVGDFVESVSYGSYKICQVRGSNPCRGAKTSISFSNRYFNDSGGVLRSGRVIPNIRHVL
jgi:hypothetical protein